MFAKHITDVVIGHNCKCGPGGANELTLGTKELQQIASVGCTLAAKQGGLLFSLSNASFQGLFRSE